jgi:hypothetical protein
MRQLCDTAHRLAGGIFRTKLLLPQSQLLYADITVTDDPDADIRTALEDLTPYSADQLIYDSSGSGELRKVIAVARDTLDEATGFISQFGFNPTGFSTIPPEGQFEGEPNLGDFKGATFIPDRQAVRISDATAPADTPSAITAPPLVVEPDPIPEPTPESNTRTEPAAFSSRRQSNETASERVGERITKRIPRIAIPEKTSKSPAPKVQIPLRDEEPPKSVVKAPSPSRPIPPIIPAPASVAEPAEKRSALSRFRREKSAVADTPPPVAADPLAAYAAKQSAGKPRFLGLILTAVLVIAIGLFAVLSSYLLPDASISSWFGTDNEAPVEIVDVADEEASDLEEFDTASLPFDTALPGSTPDFNDLPIDQDLPEVVETPAQPPETPTVPSGPLDEASAQTAYVATGIWQRAPDFGKAAKPDTLDDLYVASLDPNPAFEDAPALLRQNRSAGDSQAVKPKAPPPPGVRYDLDARGLVRPTPDGALSPEGVIVFAGPPPIAPVRRDNSLVPSGLAPAIIDLTEPEPQIETALLTPTIPAQTGPFADPALAGFKPRQRPADLSDRVERARLGGKTRAELARLRPGQRPQTILDQAEIFAEARAAEAAAQAQAIQDALAQAETDAAAQERAASLTPLDEDTAATELAVATSLKPPARPRGFENIVKSARKAPAQSQPEVQTASAARATGPAVARGSRVRPSGPTAGTVARAATDNNAISLGQVALVGVFGTSSSRRALVRLPSGRFKKVSVGDRVDGGKVAAIGASELKYTKSGRTLTLKMPKG